jgi:hypothetical protein
VFTYGVVGRVLIPSEVTSFLKAISVMAFEAVTFYFFFLVNPFHCLSLYFFILMSEKDKSARDLKKLHLCFTTNKPYTFPE